MLLHWKMYTHEVCSSEKNLGIFFVTKETVKK